MNKMMLSYFHVRKKNVTVGISTNKYAKYKMLEYKLSSPFLSSFLFYIFNQMAPIKVIGASLGRCGTDSLRVALDMLG